MNKQEAILYYAGLVLRMTDLHKQLLTYPGHEHKQSVINKSLGAIEITQAKLNEVIASDLNEFKARPDIEANLEASRMLLSAMDQVSTVIRSYEQEN